MELAHQGAQVMQVRAVELGWVNDVVIEVLSSFEDAPGTQIKEDPLVEQRNKVRGIAHDRNVAKITLVDVPDKPGVARGVFGPLAEHGINVDMIVQNVGHGGATDLSFTIPRVELAKAKRILEPLVRDLGFRDMTTDSSVAKVSIVGAGIHNAPGYAARMFGTLADAGINIEMISTSEIRITTIIAEDRVEEAVRALHAAFELEEPEAVEAAARPAERPVTDLDPVHSALSRLERFGAVGVDERHRPRLAGRRRAGGLRRRGRRADGRPRPRWAGPGRRPPGPRCCCPLGFRPTWLDARARLARWARPSPLAMCDAAEEDGGLPVGSIRLQVAQRPRGRDARAARRSWPGSSRPRGRARGWPAPLELRKLAGVLGESDGLGTDDPARGRRHRDQRGLGRATTSRRSSPGR